MPKRTRLYVLSLGFIENDVALNYYLPHQATVDDKNKPAQWNRVPSWALLIDHPKLGWVLIDSGSHPDAMDGYWPEEVTRDIVLVREEHHMLEAQLSALGLAPSDINYVIMSHLHLDHAGNLHLFSGTEAGERVIVQESELKQALFDTCSGEGTMRNGYHRPDFLDVPGIRFEIVNGDLELAPDLKLISLPGHSAGLLGALIHLEKAGSFVFTSDAVNWAPNLGPPLHISGVFYDTVEMVKSMRRVKWLMERYDAQPVFGHDPGQIGSLLQAPDGYYE